MIDIDAPLGEILVAVAIRPDDDVVVGVAIHVPGARDGVAELGLGFIDFHCPGCESVEPCWSPVVDISTTFPGLAIFLTVLSVSLIGDGLNDAFNPKLRER